MAKRLPEQALNDKVMGALRGLDPVRVENIVGDGTPDINYIGGWIEDKLIKQWPARVDTIVRVPHYRPDQRAWHVRRRVAGGRVHVVIQVGDDVLVFDALDAAKGLGFWSRAEMNRIAVCVMYPWNAEKFRRCIDRLRGVGNVRHNTD